MKMKKIYLKLMLVGMLILMSVGTAYATDSVDIAIPVSQDIVMENPHDTLESTTFHYELSTDQEDAPMPAGSEDGEYFFSISGMDSETEIPLHFTHAGVYHYTLHQVDHDTEFCVCDHTCYDCTIYVQNEPSGDLSTQMIVEEDNGEKCGEIMFRTAYRDISHETEPENPVPETPQTPDGSSPDAPNTPTTEAPQTGDTGSITFWLTMAAFSLAALIFLPFLGRSKQH